MFLAADVVWYIGDAAALADMLDRRLADIVLKKVDVSYGGENGFNQAIALSADSLANVKFIQERELINKYFDEINQDTGKFCFGVKDTMTVRVWSLCARRRSCQPRSACPSYHAASDALLRVGVRYRRRAK